MQENARTKRNLIIFTIVVIASGWIGQLINRATQSEPEESLGMLLWLVAPLIAMLLLRAFAGDGWKDIGLPPNFKGNLQWYLVALLVFPVITLICAYVGKWAGWIDMSGFDYGVFGKALLLALIPNFIKNIPEEFVWRGYLTPKLLLLKVSDWQLYLLVGLIWGVWHVPYYLYFLGPETVQGFTSLSLGVFIPLTVLTMVAWSVVFVEIWRITGSIWPAVLMHMVEDAFVNPMALDPNFRIDAGKELLIHPAMGVLSIALYVAVGLWIRRERKKKFV